MRRSLAKAEKLDEHVDALSLTGQRRLKDDDPLDEQDETTTSKEEGLQRWRNLVETRFLNGQDADFPYEEVDGNEAFDDQRTMERERQEEWFDDEEPSPEDGPTATFKGQTGVQDF